VSAPGLLDAWIAACYKLQGSTRELLTESVSMRLSQLLFLEAVVVAMGVMAIHGCSAGGGGDSQPVAAGSGGSEAGPETGASAGAGGSAGSAGSGQAGHGAVAGAAGSSGTAGAAGSAGSAGAAAAAGSAGSAGSRASGHTATDLVSNAFKAQSPNYKIIGSLGQGPGGNTVMRSANYKLHGGLVGATQAP
jgi:hypothetical protein